MNSRIVAARAQKSAKVALLIVLMAVLAFNFVDRLALGLLMQEIKVDLHLTDTQLGFLSGIAFTLFYAVMGIPIARWADRGNRVVIIAITTALWSVMVSLCGAAASFSQLLLIRVGVGVGEAGCTPTANSLIADYFPRAERPRAVAIYMLGGPLSMVIGFLVAGWLNQLYGWRMTFVLLGLPGVVLAAIALWALKEPRRGSEAFSSRSSLAAPTLRQVLATLWANRTLAHLLLSYSVIYFFGYGIMQWQPTYFIRSYGMQTGPLGSWFAGIFGIGGMLGTYFGGEVAARYAADNEGLQMRCGAIAVGTLAVFSCLIYISYNRYVAFMLLGLTAIGVTMINGPLFATIQTLVEERMRATVIALVYLSANLIGMGLGPLAAGSLSDALRPRFGGESLRYALLILSPGYFWAAWHMWRASQTVAHDLKAAQA